MTRLPWAAALLLFCLIGPVCAGEDANDSQSGTEGISRWLEVDDASFSLRYQNSINTNGTHIFDDTQERSLLAGKFKLDKQGKWFIGFRASSGGYFNWSFSNFSGINNQRTVDQALEHISLPRYDALLTAFYADPARAGVQRNIVANGWAFYVRDLYLSATPVHGLTFEFGSIPIERGAGSEITTYDDDGYMSGERVRLKCPEIIYLDQIELTSSYLGDPFKPNFFDRYDRLTESNYRQLLGEKSLAKRLKASADYTWLWGTHTMREAAVVAMKESRVVDSSRLELYQRLNDVMLPGYLAKAAYGWALTGTKLISKRLRVEGGYASVDQDYGVYSGSSALAAMGFSLNGDAYQAGERFFGRASVKVLPGASFFGFYTHQINSKETPLEYSFARQGLDFGMELDLRSMLRSAHLL